MSVMKARMHITGVSHESGTSQTIRMRPVTGGCEENETFAKYTPWGELVLGITNPKLIDTFKIGDEYTLDFTKVK